MFNFFCGPVSKTLFVTQNIPKVCLCSRSGLTVCAVSLCWLSVLTVCVVSLCYLPVLFVLAVCAGWLSVQSVYAVCPDCLRCLSMLSVSPPLEEPMYDSELLPSFLQHFKHWSHEWAPSISGPGKIGRAHVWTPVTSAHLVCRLLLEKKKKKKLT